MKTDFIAFVIVSLLGAALNAQVPAVTAKVPIAMNLAGISDYTPG